MAVKKTGKKSTLKIGPKAAPRRVKKSLAEKAKAKKRPEAKVKMPTGVLDKYLAKRKKSENDRKAKRALGADARKDLMDDKLTEAGKNRFKRDALHNASRNGMKAKTVETRKRAAKRADAVATQALETNLARDAAALALAAPLPAITIPAPPPISIS